MGHVISEELLANTNIVTVEQQVGRAEQGEDTWEPNRSEFHVELRDGVPGAEQEKLMKEIGNLLDGFPGISSQVVTFLGNRISETISGETTPVVFTLYGVSLHVIDAKPSEISPALNSAPLRK